MRRLAIFVAAILLATGGVAAAVVLGGGSSDPEESPVEAPSGDAVAVVTTVTPAAHRFGDAMMARIEIAVDGRLADPDDVQLRVQFAPFEVVGEVTTSRRAHGDATVIVYEYPLQCLATSCLSPGAALDVELPRAAVSFVQFDTGLGVDLRIAWPTVRVAGRASEAVISLPAETSFGELPAPTYRIDPATLRWLATSVAAVIVLVVGVWIAWLLRPRRRVQPAEPAVVGGPSSIAVALARVNGAREAPGPTRRAALEALATELDHVNGAALAAEARRLAWSRDVPDAREVEELAEAVGRNEEGTR